MSSIIFDLPKEQASIIKVIGVGGGGSNAVNHMFLQGIRGVNFVICNTDAQAMELSLVPNKIQLGPLLTNGLGANFDPEIGRKAAEESLDDIRVILEKNTKMVFITAGMGGGSGTGGAPVIAKLSKEMGILTVGVVTMPFTFEGPRKMMQAEEGIDKMRQNVDSLIVISNDKIRKIYGNLTKSDAFAKTDYLLELVVRSISEIITVPGQINVDFADLRYVLKDSGFGKIGFGAAGGKDRALVAAQKALTSQLLDNSDVKGSKKILLSISSGIETPLSVDEINEIHEQVLESSGQDADVIFGVCEDRKLKDEINVTIIFSAFGEGMTLKSKLKESDIVKNLLDISSPLLGRPDEKKALSLFFNLEEFSKDEISDVIFHLAEIYKEIGGDKLVIKGASIYEYEKLLEPIDLQ